MKNLRLSTSGLNATNVLTREQLRGITGGIQFGGTCTCPDGVVYTCANSIICNEEASSKCGSGQTPTCTYGGSQTF